MKRIRGRQAIWVAAIIDAEDMAIRKRQGLPMPVVPMSYANTDEPISDFEAGMMAYRLAGRKRNADDRR
jgi:hypothetical protein